MDFIPPELLFITATSSTCNCYFKFISNVYATIPPQNIQNHKTQYHKTNTVSS